MSRRRAESVVEEGRSAFRLQADQVERGRLARHYGADKEGILANHFDYFDSLLSNGMHESETKTVKLVDASTQESFDRQSRVFGSP